MYRWWVFLHLVGVFGFLLTHGISVGVMFRVRKERDRERLKGLLALSSSSTIVLYVSLAVLLAGGIIAGFSGHWWGRRWIWAALILLIAIAGAMYPLGTKFHRRISDGLGTRPSGAPVASDEEIADLVSSGRPMLIAAIGFGGLLVILWLMVFKPF